MIRNLGIAAKEKELDQNLDAKQALGIGKSNWGNRKIFYKCMIACGDEVMQKICDENKDIWMSTPMMRDLRDELDKWSQKNKASKMHNKQLRDIVAMPRSFDWFLTINKNKFF